MYVWVFLQGLVVEICESLYARVLTRVSLTTLAGKGKKMYPNVSTVSLSEYNIFPFFLTPNLPAPALSLLKFQCTFISEGDSLSVRLLVSGESWFFWLR